MEFKNFEKEFFKDLNILNHNCINIIENNKDLIQNNLGEQGNINNIESFINGINECILLQASSNDFNLFEQILRHSFLATVFEAFKKSDILIRVCNNNNGKCKDLLLWLLTLNIDYCVQDNNGMTALMYAVKNPNLLFIVKDIIKNGKECLKIVDNHGENAIFHALQNNEALEEIVKTDIDINQKNHKGETVLIYCCQHDISSAMPYLMNRPDIDVNIVDNKNWTAAMYLAEKAKNTELRSLNLRCCNYDYVNEKNESVLSIIIQKLYEPNQSKSYDTTQTELISNYLKILMALVNFNCDFNIPVDEDGNTALMVFMIVNDFYSFYYVINNSENYDLSVRNKYGENASSLSVKIENYHHYYKYMINHPTFDYKYIDPQTNNSMLMLCTLSQATFIKDILTKKNINSISSINNKKENALILATKVNNELAVKELLEHGININQQDDLGNTALHYAIETKNLNLTHALLSDCADVNIKNNEGKSSLDLANEINDESIKNLINHPPSFDYNTYINSHSENNNNRNSHDSTTCIMETSQEAKAAMEYLYLNISPIYSNFEISDPFLNIEKETYAHRISDITDTNTEIPSCHWKPKININSNIAL